MMLKQYALLILKAAGHCGLSLILMLAATTDHTLAQPTGPRTALDFRAQLLLILSDADMLASAYMDDQLGPSAGPDALTVVQLDQPPRNTKPVEIGVSNSVTGPPSAIAVSPDGRFAVVIQTKQSRLATTTRLSELATGRTITVVALADPQKPTIVQQLQGPPGAKSVEFNRDGSLVAITFEAQASSQVPLAFYRFNKGELSPLAPPTLPGWQKGDALNGAVFHPRENILALLNTTRATLMVVRFANYTPDDSRTLQLAAHGSPVPIEREPFKACFTPDGRFIVINSMYSASLPGAVVSVQLSASTAPDGSPVHQLVSRALAGVLPEGLAMSPDARWVVTTNLEQSFQPLDSPQQSFYASLSLLRLEPTSGHLERVGEFGFDGILPESAVFDKSSRYLAVTSFDHYGTGQGGGSVDFWRLGLDANDSKRALLIKTAYSIPVRRGAHSMAIVR